MAGYVQTIGEAISTATASATLVIPITKTTNLGNTVLIAAGGYTSHYVSSATDSRGNTYSVDKKGTLSHTVSIVRAHLATPLHNGDHITLTYSNSASFYVAIAFEYNGIVATTPVDVSNYVHVAGGSGGSVSASVTPTTRDIIFSAFAQNGVSGTWSVASPFAIRAQHTRSGSNQVGGADAVRTTTSSVTCHFTSTNTTNASLAVVAYKQVARVATPAQFFSVLTP